MVYLAALGVCAAILAMYGLFILLDHRQGMASERDRELIALLEMAIQKTGVPKETIEAVGNALAKNLVGYSIPVGATSGHKPSGMDDLGLDERTGMDKASFPDIEYDPWMSQEVAEELANADTTLPVDAQVNGDGSEN